MIKNKQGGKQNLPLLCEVDNVVEFERQVVHTFFENLYANYYHTKVSESTLSRFEKLVKAKLTDPKQLFLTGITQIEQPPNIKLLKKETLHEVKLEPIDKPIQKSGQDKDQNQTAQDEDIQHFDEPKELFVFDKQQRNNIQVKVEVDPNVEQDTEIKQWTVKTEYCPTNKSFTDFDEVDSSSLSSASDDGTFVDDTQHIGMHIIGVFDSSKVRRKAKEETLTLTLKDAIVRSISHKCEKYEPRIECCLNKMQRSEALKEEGIGQVKLQAKENENVKQENQYPTINIKQPPQPDQLDLDEEPKPQ